MLIHWDRSLEDFADFPGFFHHVFGAKIISPMIIFG
jgi:hypothetical protein